MPTTKTLKNPTAVAHPNPIDLDLAIETLRESLEVITWLTKSFHRAKETIKHNPDGKGGTLRVPMVYQAGGEYYPVMPNDALQAYSFFRVSGGRDFIDQVTFQSELNSVCPMDMIVWVNLKKIDRAKDYIFTEELIRDVVNILNQNTDVELIRVWDEKPEDIFRGYTLEEVHRDLLLYPYQAFRIELNLNYSIACLDS